jgi:hypothetical protein
MVNMKVMQRVGAVAAAITVAATVVVLNATSYNATHDTRLQPSPMIDANAGPEGGVGVDGEADTYENDPDVVELQLWVDSAVAGPSDLLGSYQVDGSAFVPIPTEHIIKLPGSDRTAWTQAFYYAGKGATVKGALRRGAALVHCLITHAGSEPKPGIGKCVLPPGG